MIEVTLPRERVRQKCRAFTTIELLIAVCVFAVVGVSVMLGLSQGFRIVNATQRNLRATQIMQEQAEIVRLYTWEQINSNGFVPPTFTAPFSVVGSNVVGGIQYTGRIDFANANITDGYSNDMKMVTITLNWPEGPVQRQRTLKTLISHYGLHNYYYHNYP